MEILIPILILFFGAFTHSLAGFGIALVAMAFLPAILGAQVAAPLVAMAALTIEAILLLRYHTALNLRTVWPLVLASVIGIPLGLYFLQGVSEKTFLTLLGIILAGYALYGLLKFRLPELRHPAWGWLAGFLAGILGGAYNTSGPPVVLYADCRRWSPAEFKGNLQGFFVFNDLLVVVSHAFSHNLTPAVWQHYLWAVPAILLGIFVGTRLDRLINLEAFRKIILWMLIMMGLRMIFAA